MTILANDYVVMQGDAKGFGCFHHRFGHFYVSARGGRVA
jgi:hypothetical protein